PQPSAPHHPPPPFPTRRSSDLDIVREMQVRSALATVLEKQRLAAVDAPVREQFESDLRSLTEAEQDSKELRSAKRTLLFERIVRSEEHTSELQSRGRLVCRRLL